MTAHTAHTRTNRLLLALLGLTLTGGGLLVLAGGADLYRHWNLSPPDGWPLRNHHDVLFTSADESRWAGQSWWWPTAVAALAALALLAVAWLLAQGRARHKPLPVGGTSRRTAVRLTGAVLADALAEDLATVPGVEHARARVAHPRGHPESRIDLTLAPDAAPRHVLTELREPLARAERTLGRHEFPTRVTLHVPHHPPRRVD
ncbi:hypothetical protein SAMN05216267_1002268 [Actinacidiphila rubida]|uniref:Alkaline shock response membrane anchor protein AmaP n=1 Tax=Actinacidiphila rubida TaxID=310780 RepID=A0A1H8ELH8_9ACTN|nr:hypothetical protein [Actinacidiphila rubida]SEN20333.1 hypothetical protein SAMN05216267_1002268 [Actinacidiphila rubida]